MSLDTLIADTRKAISDDAASAQAVFAVHGTLVGVTEVDIRTGAHTFKVDEPPVLGGADAAGEPGAVCAGLARVLPGHHVPLLGRAARRGAGHAERAGRRRPGPARVLRVSTTRCGRALPRSGSR